MRNLGWVAAAGVIGFAGNELVALYRIRVGRRIGSAALVADGLHARTDGLTSLAVVLGAAGVALGWQLADPVIGLVITVAILAVLRTAARDVYRRLMDAVDPALLDDAERALAEEPGVLAVRVVRMRWIGHTLHAEAELSHRPGDVAGRRARPGARRGVTADRGGPQADGRDRARLPARRPATRLIPRP